MKNLKKLKRQNFILFLLGFVFLTSGCATSPAPEGYVAKQWATAFRELQITPIFPPREDVQVGDIYVVPVAPDDEDAIFEARGYLPRGMWVHTLDLNSQINAFYEQRPSFPQTNIERVELFKTTWERIKDQSAEDIKRYTENYIEFLDSFNRAYPALPQPVSSTDLWDASGKPVGDARRLRIVGFPEFLSATFTQGDLSAFLPTDSGSTGAQAMFSDARSVTVKVPVAESYGLPMSIILPALRDQQTYPPSKWGKLGLNLNLDDVSHSPFDYVNAFADHKDGSVRLDAQGNFVVRLRIATEVYYARVLDITIQATKQAAASVQVTDAAPTEGESAAGNSGSTAPDDDDVDVDDQASAELRAARLENRISALEKDKSRVPEGALPGGSARVLSVSNNQIGMRRVFDRPVAIGFRGFDFDVTIDAVTGKFISFKIVGITNSRIARGAD